MTITILTGCCLSILSTLPSQSVHTCVTSPPYWGLRDYGQAGQLGLEPTPEEYVQKMVGVFREVRRVLREDGTLWLNLGDSYAGSGRGGNPTVESSTLQGSQCSQQASIIGRKMRRGSLLPAGLHETARQAGAVGRAWVPPPAGLKQKDLVGIPWMVAFALRADGWYLRSDVIWSKPNPMPESVTDRPTKSHEYLFLLSKSDRYFYDHEAVKEPMAAASVERLSQDVQSQRGSDRANGGAKTNGPMRAVGNPPKGNAKTFRGGGAYTGNRAFDNSAVVGRDSHGNAPNESGLRNRRSVWEVATIGFSEAHFATFPPKLIEPCILAGSPVGGVVLDPFFGAGTTGLVADRHGRHCIGVELNESYVLMAERRIRADSPMFADVRIVPASSTQERPSAPQKQETHLCGSARE